MNYQPKGGMCVKCSLRYMDCSHLPFSTMKVIQKDASTSIVKCTHYSKEEN